MSVDEISAFTSAHAVTARWEGGYVNHPADPGGATNKGVTQRVYDAWRRTMGLSQRPVRDIEQREVLAIYREQYWNALRCERLPPGIDLAVYDFGVNSGVSRAARYLQAALGVKQDGHIGEVTIRAARDAWERGEAGKVIAAIMDGRLAFLQGLRTFGTFGKGWTARVANVRKEALNRALASRKNGPNATVILPRSPVPDNAYQPDKATAAPKDQNALAKTATKVVVATGAAGGAAAQAKDLFGELVSPSVLLTIIIIMMIGAAAVALYTMRPAEGDEDKETAE